MFQISPTKFQFLQIHKKNERQDFFDYTVLFNIYNPPLSFYETLRKLILRPETDIFIIDSSPTDNVLVRLRSIIQSINTLQPININIFYYRIPNCGVPYAINFGIKQIKERKYRLVTIFTDDTSLVRETFPAHKIYEYFYKNCDPSKDAMVIPNNENDLKKKYILRTTEAGMTMDLSLFNKIQFREDLIIDQYDPLFCDNIYEKGGKILIYPEVLLRVAPIGRMGKSGLPDWRLYLLTRNTIALSLEHKNSFFRDVILQNLFWYKKAILYGKQRIKYLRAFFLGFYDGTKHNLGISENLQLLSEHRFSIKCDYLLIQHLSCKDRVGTRYSDYDAKKGED